MDAFESLFLRKLLERLNKEISIRVAHLCEGKVADYAAYREKVGAIQALKDVGEKLCPQIRSELMRSDEEPSPVRVDRQQARRNPNPKLYPGEI